jgi:DegV family protein with EDD domain
MVKIVTDSGSDITPELARELDIAVVPLYLAFGEKTYRDGVDISADEFYARLVNEHVHPTTSAPSPGDFASVYRELAADNDEIISIHISKKLSATYDAALGGKEQLAGTKCRIEVVDSQSVTTGLGLIVIAAAQAAARGSSLKQVLEVVQKATRQVRLVGLLDTLRYLAKGGRLGKAASLLGAMLNVKALLILKDGEIHPLGVVRTLEKGLDRLCESARAMTDIQDVGLGYSTPTDGLQKLAERLRSLLPHIHPRVLRIGPALGVHGGPGALILALRGE